RQRQDARRRESRVAQQPSADISKIAANGFVSKRAHAESANYEHAGTIQLFEEANATSRVCSADARSRPPPAQIFSKPSSRGYRSCKFSLLHKAAMAGTFGTTQAR